MRNLLGSLSFFGNFLRRTAEQCSFNGVLANSNNFSLLVNKLLMVEANLGMRMRASAKLMLKFKSWKIWKNFSTWSLAFLRSLWSLSLDGYGIDGFRLGFRALTGASTGSTTGATTGSEFGFNQNQNRSNPNQNYQNRNQGNNHVNPQRNNQGRNQFFQGASHGQNPLPAYQASAYQALGYQASVQKASIPQPQVVTATENLFLPLDNPELTIRRRSRSDPTLLNNSKMAAEEPDDLPVPDLQTMEELCQPSLNGKRCHLKNMQTNTTSLTNSNIELKNMFGQFMKMNTASSSSSRTLPGNTITNSKEDLNGITTRRGTAYPGPTIPTTSSSPVVECETKAIKDMMHPANNESTEDVQPPVVQSDSPILNTELVNSPINEPVAFPVNALRPNHRSLIPYPSRLQDQKLRDKANDQREKFFQIFNDLNFNISFADALILMLKFGLSIKILLTSKDKLCDLARTPLNEHCSAVLLKKLPEKLGDPGKFLIPCDFSRMAECLALANLGASINLIPLSVWNKLFLPDFSPTCMTLDLTDHLISYPVGVAEHVFVKVGTFHFPADFVVVDFDADPRVPLILGRSFLKTERALIDVFEGDILLQKAFLNDDPSLPPPNQGYYMPEFRKELKIYEVKSDKSSIDEPLEVELKDLPPHLEYVFMEGDDKLPVIIAKDFSVEEKTTLITGLKSYKRAIAWKLSDIKEVLKLLDAGLIYPISDTPFSPVHCVPKNDGFTVVENEENELILTRLVTGWHVCINYHGIVLGHKISKEGIEVDKSKVDVITRLPHPTTVKGIRSFLGHAGFYRRFIKDFSKIARPMTRLLKKDTPFLFSKECVEAFQTLKRKLTEASILIAPNWDMPFELMCDASDLAIGAVLGQCPERTHFCNDQFAKVMLKFGVTHRLATPYHPQTSGQVEVFSGKLNSRWSGPFTISHIFPYGTVELSQPDGPNFKVNGHRLKHYFGEDVPKTVVPDLQTFLKDH
nr:reverse transcriptase domain-containing protein [Tanacetum cinerariifolium]